MPHALDNTDPALDRLPADARPFHQHFTDDGLTVLNYYLAGAELFTATYDRRSTQTTWTVETAPRSLS